MIIPFFSHGPRVATRAEVTAVSLFTLFYLVLAFFFATGLHNWEFVYYASVVLILGIVVLLVHRRVGLSRGVLWSLSLWGLLHMIGGLAPVPVGWAMTGSKPVFYSMWVIPGLLKFDHIVHAYGFGVATWLCWQTIRFYSGAEKPRPALLVLSALAGMGLGAFNEVIEFFAVLLIPETNVGGYINTGWDLVANMIGCSITAVWIWVLYKEV